MEILLRAEDGKAPTGNPTIRVVLGVPV